MPSANMRSLQNSTTGADNVKTMPVKAPEFNISAKDVEDLVMEIKENLRVSSNTMKAVPCSHLSRKSSRASPYRVPGKLCTCENSLCDAKMSRRKIASADSMQDQDPYELLQKLLKDGNLVNEAVRRVQLGLSPKQRYFYESDEELSPLVR